MCATWSYSYVPVLLRGLSPFSDSSRKGVDSDTVRDTCMCHLTTKLLGNKLEFRQMEKWCIHYRQPINLFRNVSIKKKNTNLLRKVLHLDNIWFISRLIFSAFYLISWTLVLFVIFISSFFLFTPSVRHFLTLITTSAPRACFSKLRESRLQITIQVCAASQPEI